MPTRNKVVLIGIIVSLICINLISDESWKLYDDSEVALIEITVDPFALEWMYSNVWSDSMHNATVHFSNAYIDETIDNVGFRLRGNTSRIANKKSFKLSFNTFVNGRQFYDVDKMNLNGEHNDPSIIRSKLCWDQYSEIGQISSRSNHTAVYINDFYFGLYISVEHIDDEFLTKNFADDTGNLWKCHYPARLTFLGDDPDNYKLEQNGTRVYELKTNLEADDYSQLARLIDVLNNTPTYNISDSLETIINVSSVVKYLATDVLTGSWDDYWYGKNNFYIYHEPTADKFFIIPFDYDNTFGVDWMNIDWTERDIYVFKHQDASRPLADRFLENSEYRNLYSHFLEFYTNNVYELTIWENHIDSIKDVITNWVESDYYRTLDYNFTMDDFYDSYSIDHYENQHVKRGIKEFINLRSNSILEQLQYLNATPVIYEIDWFPKLPQASDTIYVEVSTFSNVELINVEIHFYPEDTSVPEIYPMLFDPMENSNLVEENDRWTGIIPTLDNTLYGYFRIKATDTNGEFQYFPRNDNIYLEAIATGMVDIVINELLALNNCNNSDEAGEFDDWLELCNPTNETIDISGMFLSDDAENLNKWEVPNGTYISSENYIAFWCDEDQEQGISHTNFKLSGDGESVFLTAADGETVIDSVTFGEQTDDISLGRFPDGEDFWTLLQPTFASSNNTLSTNFNDISPIFNITNFPNPFNPNTTFEFSIQNNSNIELSIYNIKGQKIKTLAHDYFEKGNHSIIWDGDNDSGELVSSGIYCYRLNINGKNEAVKKCLLLK